MRSESQQRLSFVDVPQYRWVTSGRKKKFVEYRVDFWLAEGTAYTQRHARFSALHRFHTKIKSQFGKKVPDFPPKKLRNNDRRFIEHRQKELSHYFQAFLQREELISCLLTYFSIHLSHRRRCEELTRPILGFLHDVTFFDDVSHVGSRSELPNVVILGVLEAFYE
uniref:Sorting nexin-24 n=1 Tax=Caligus clemensi TaxID=344056 RepID=C1C1E6_CALCM|nr:Sorting nexin-24 [Caligus clemensi]